MAFLPRSPPATSDTTRREQLKCLCDTFGLRLPIEFVQHEVERLRHVAARCAEQDGLPSRDAWLRAAVMARRTGHLKPKIMHLLVRYWASGASTSGVEQGFSKMMQVEGVHAAALCNDHYDDRMELLEITKGEAATRSQRAAKIWSQVYGSPRQSGLGNRCPRIDAGSSKKRTADSAELSADMSERQWLRARADHVTTLAQSSAASSSAPSVDPSTWTASHDKEVAFAGNKRIRNLAEDALAGRYVALTAATADDLRNVIGHLTEQGQTDKTYKATVKRREKLRQPLARRLMDGNSVFLAADLTHADLGRFEHTARRQNLVKTTDPRKASSVNFLEIRSPLPKSDCIHGFVDMGPHRFVDMGPHRIQNLMKISDPTGS